MLNRKNKFSILTMKPSSFNFYGTVSYLTIASNRFPPSRFANLFEKIEEKDRKRKILSLILIHLIQFKLIQTIHF